MTEQEALKYMKLFRDEWDRDSKTQNAMALDVSIKALKKQIAKKPVKRSFIVPYEGINVCPSCKEPLPSSKEHHCKCGQKLDWGNEDAE